MINTSSKTKSLLKEIDYNKITIIISLFIILLIQTYPQYVYGPVFWSEFLLLIFLFITVCCALGCLGLIGFLGLGSMFLIVPFRPFTVNFWDALTFAGDPEQYGLAAVFLEQKDYFLTHPGLVSLYTSLIFLCILWKHPNPYEKRCAHSPMKILDCIIKYNDIKIIGSIFLIAYLFSNKITATIATWAIAYFLLFKFLLPVMIGTKEPEKDKLAIAAYFIIVFSYAILGGGKAPLDALLGIITLNP